MTDYVIDLNMPETVKSHYI